MATPSWTAGPVTPEHVIQAAAVCRQTLAPVVDRDWSIPAGSLKAGGSLPASRAMNASSSSESKLALPSAPVNPVVYLDAPNRPQPRFDVGREGGMAVTVGRLRPCRVLDAKFFCLGHNTVRGAAGAAVLNAELMVAQGWLD
mgnify:CR=1 FL=1